MPVSSWSSSATRGQNKTLRAGFLGATNCGRGAKFSPHFLQMKQRLLSWLVKILKPLLLVLNYKKEIAKITLTVSIGTSLLYKVVLKDLFPKVHDNNTKTIFRKCVLLQFSWNNPLINTINWGRAIMFLSTDFYCTHFLTTWKQKHNELRQK